MFPAECFGESIFERYTLRMLILIGVALAVGVFVVTVIASAGRRSGLLELGAVSTQWLAEHREYQEGGRSR